MNIYVSEVVITVLGINKLNLRTRESVFTKIGDYSGYDLPIVIDG
jgi:hypothetical protein